MRFLLLLLLVIPCVAYADLSTVDGDLDDNGYFDYAVGGTNSGTGMSAAVQASLLSKAGGSITIHNQSAAPSTPCVNDSLWVDSDAATGERLYACESGAWVQQGGTAAAHTHALSGITDAGTAAAYDTGSDIGDVPVYEDDGEGNASLPLYEVIDSSGFNGNLSTTDDTLVEVAQKFDDFTGGSGLSHISTGYPDAGECAWNTADYKLYCNTGGSVYASAAMSYVDSSAPVLSTVVLSGADGDTYTFTYDQAVQASTTADLCDDFVMTWTTAGTVTPLTYSSGTGTTTVVCESSTSVEGTDTLTNGVDYTPGTIQDGNSNLLASIDDQSVTNSSTYTSGVTFSADETFNFDAGSLGDWSETTGTNSSISVETTAALDSSTYGVEFSYSANSGDDAIIDLDTTSHYTDEIGVRFRLRIVTGSSFTFSGNNAMLLSLNEDSQYEGSSQLRLEYDSGWYLYADHPGDTDQTALSVDTDYEIMVRYVLDGSTGGFVVWLDDTEIIRDLDNDTSARTHIGHLQLGVEPVTGQVSSGSEFHIDEIEIGTITE